MKNVWPFQDEKNTAVFTTRSVAKEGKPILHVFHNDDDGAWQFHHDMDPQQKDAMVLALSEIIEIDETIAQLADLPCGWHAWRSKPSESWRRAKQTNAAG